MTSMRGQFSPAYEGFSNPEGLIHLSALAWSPDGRTLVAYSRNLLTVLSVDLDPGSLIRTAIKAKVSSPRIDTLSFSPDGHHLIGVGDRFTLWFTTFGTLLRRHLSEIKQAEAIGMLNLPVLRESVDVARSPLSKYQMLPRNGKPINQWRNKNTAFTEVASELRATLYRVGAASITRDTSFAHELAKIPD